ncbi:arsenate reductase ArsC [Nemorincola caseinilytica]|uniref:Arsenate reductase ArsC n=1 Tax=Nemorincola caseinilytica TaxID=2054315 RepID=A0ABP8N5M0_9BACT
MYRVLFVCIHNSARSQMAEAFLKAMSEGIFYAESAGIEKGRLNPTVVRAMWEVGIDISDNETNEVAQYLGEGRTYDAVITVCDAVSAERCPTFPGNVKKFAWYFADPSQFMGSEEEMLAQVRIVRDEIRESVEDLIKEAKENNYWK